MSPFWNAAEHRLRAGWRIVLAAAAIFALTAGGTWGVDAAFGGSGLVARVLARTATTLLVTALSIALGGRLLDRRRIADFGLRLHRAWWADVGAGLIVGSLAMTLIVAVEWGAGWITLASAWGAGRAQLPLATTLLLPLLYYTAVGINEEVLTRGYGLRNLAEGLNVPRIGARRAIVLAWLLSSAVFGLLHLGNAHATVVSTLNLVLIGLLFGLPYILTGRLGLSIGMHITWNFAQGNVFGLPVSGGRSQLTLLAATEQGPDLWTGGAFGPEGGLLGILAMGIACLLVLLWVRLRDGHTSLHLPLAEYTAQSGAHTPRVRRQTPAPVQP